MKNKIALLIAALVFVGFLKAQDTGKLVISNASSVYPKFIVSLNGVRLTNEYNSSVSFNLLDEHNYRVKILQAGSSNVLSFALNSAPNYITKYLLNKDNTGNYTLILESKALMNGQSEILTNTIVTQPVNTVVVTKPTETLAVPVNTLPPAPQAMNDTDYNGMLASVKKESLESGRLDMAKTFFGNQNLSSSQVLGIVKAFSLESSKLTFAKFAYSRTVDKPNYYKVYDAFSLSGSKKEMSEYIKNNP